MMMNNIEVYLLFINILFLLILIKHSRNKRKRELAETIRVARSIRNRKSRGKVYLL